VWADFHHTEPNAFRQFYHAAEAMRAGGDIYTSHPPGDKCQFVYPPLFAFLITPLTHLRLLTAQRLWLIADVGAMLPALLASWAGNLRDLKVAFAGLGSFAGIHAEVAARTVPLTWIRSVSITSASGRLLEAWHGKPAGAFLLSGPRRPKLVLACALRDAAVERLGVTEASAH
jgi:hypothetical protein